MKNTFGEPTKTRKTQSQCRLDFAAAMLKLTDVLEKIDRETPAQPTQEPDWWLRMMEMHRTALNYARIYGAENE